MTSVSGAGYQSKKKGFDPLKQGHGPAPALAEKADNGPEDLAKEMERQARLSFLGFEDFNCSSESLIKFKRIIYCPVSMLLSRAVAMSKGKVGFKLIK